MLNNNLTRMAGMAGIFSAISMLAMTAVVGDGSSPSPMLFIFLVVGSLLGLMLTAGLYLYYRDEESTWSMLAAAAALTGYLCLIIVGLLALGFESPLAAIGDVLVYVVGVTLFSWLGYRTGKMPRVLAIVGFVGAAAGLANYAIATIFGADWTNPNDPLAGLLSVLFIPYLFGTVIWLAWTGYTLLSAKVEPTLA